MWLNCQPRVRQGNTKPTFSGEWGSEFQTHPVTVGSDITASSEATLSQPLHISCYIYTQTKINRGFSWPTAFRMSCRQKLSAWVSLHLSPQMKRKLNIIVCSLTYFHHFQAPKPSNKTETEWVKSWEKKSPNEWTTHTEKSILTLPNGLVH